MAREKNTTTERLKQMHKSHNKHTLRSLVRVCKYGIIGFGRNIWLSLTSTLVITLTLLLLFVTVIASAVLSSTADAMRDKIDITIYFKPGTEVSVLEDMSKTMSKDKNVKSVTFSTSDEEYKKFVEETKTKGENELLTTLSDDAMKDIMLKSMQATMRVKVYDADNLDSIKKLVATDPVISKNLDSTKDPTYDTNDTAINTINSWANIAKNGGIALCILFLIISVLVIFNTIRMAIYSRSEEIYMEKLVGADNRFIRGPFLIEAMMSGAIAGIISSILGLIAFNALSPKLADYDIQVSAVSNFLSAPIDNVLVFLALVVLGMLIALISSRLAVHKYLKHI